MRKGRIVIAIALGVLVVAGVAGAILDQDDDDVTGMFLKFELDKRISMNAALKADTVCLIPNGADPFAYLDRTFPGRSTDRAYDFDSESTWYILALDDHDDTARILSVGRGKILNDFHTIVCSRNVIVTVKHDGPKRQVSVVAPTT
jgi:hypothetical protein